MAQYKTKSDFYDTAWSGFTDSSKNAMGLLLQDKLRKKQQDDELKKQIELLKVKEQIEQSDPLNQLIKQGQVADAGMKIYQAGGPFPTQFRGQPQEQQPTGEKITAINPGQEVPRFTGQIGTPSLVQSPQYQAKELDAFGRPKSFSLKEPSAAQDARNIQSSELSGQTKNIMELFNDAMVEAKGHSGDVGKEGIGGRLANFSTIMAGKAGYSPNVNIFQQRIKAFATITAKQAGEQRPTDADIERFIGAMMNFSNNDKENAIQIAQQLKDLQARGINISWAAPIVEQYEKTTGVTVKLDQSPANELGQPNRFTGQTVNQQQALPNGITEEDIQFTMQKHGLSREEVLQRIGAK